MLLMNGDRPVLYFDLDERVMKVLDNQFLPFRLKDYIVSTDTSSIWAYRESVRGIDDLRDFLACRTLNLSRENAKAILHSAKLSQSLSTEERLKIVFHCNALSMTDNFWVKDDDDKRTFSEVNLRNHHLGDAAYQISILGEQISVQKGILEPDLGTDGMFAKTWVRTDDGIYLWKADIHHMGLVLAEQMASDFLDHTNVPHVQYHTIEKDGILISECKSIVSDDVSIVKGIEFSDYLRHIRYPKYGYRTALEAFLATDERTRIDFRKMCCADVLMCNPDRHLDNIHLLVDNGTNEIMGLTLLDHNQAFLFDLKGTNDPEVFLQYSYDVSRRPILETAKRYVTDLEIDPDYSMSEEMLYRFEMLYGKEPLIDDPNTEDFEEEQTI